MSLIDLANFVHFLDRILSVPATHCLLGIVFLISSRISSRALRIGVEFIVIGSCNGVMTYLDSHRRSLPFFGNQVYNDLFALLLGIVQFVCYALIVINFLRLFGEMRRRNGAAGYGQQLPLGDDALRPWQPRKEGSRDIQP